MAGLFISFEGAEASGKSTQIRKLADRLLAHGHQVQCLREPGGTDIGEEIRHTLQHSSKNHGMMPETELLLMTASRSQLVRQIIRPTLRAGHIVLCDRYYDSTLAYQGYGRGIDLDFIRQLMDFAIEQTRPNLTLLLTLPHEISEARRRLRNHQRPQGRDRMEELDREFFRRVEEGFAALARAEPNRIKTIDASPAADIVESAIWDQVQPLVGH